MLNPNQTNKQKLEGKGLDALLKDLNNNNPSIKLTLILGAGVNEGTLSVWKGVMNSLLEASIIQLLSPFNRISTNIEELIEWINYKFSIYDQAMLVKRVLQDRYVSILHSILYKSTTQEEIQKCKLLQEIAALCTIPRVQSVITYNWDDLLETVLTEKWKAKEINLFPISVHKDTMEPSKPPKDAIALPIYHVHGFLPRIFPYLIKEQRDDHIILSLDEYTRFNTNITSWQTTIQLNALQNTACLFIGTSLTDMNMLRLLNTAKSSCNNPYLYYISSEEEITKGKNNDNSSNTKNQQKLGPAKMDLFNNYLRTLMVKSVTVKYTADISELINEIYKNISKSNGRR
ncbi:MAG: SIR2 family protein [Candidatus Cloacimonadaceae bacterium]